MKKGNIYNNIEDLFRKVMEGPEVKPGEVLSHRVMRKLDLREFMRFNPSRFNIWYMAGMITTAAVAGALIFSSGPRETKKIMPDGNKQEKGMVYFRDTVKNTIVKYDSPTINSSAKEGNKQVITKKADLEKRIIIHEEPVSAFTHSPSTGGKVKAGLVGGNSEAQTLSESSLLTAGIRASVLSGCVPLHVKFTNSSSDSTITEWRFGDGGTSDRSDPEWIYDIPGQYKVTLIVKDAKGRKAVSAVNINVYPKPQVAFEIIPANPAIPEDEVTFSNLSTGASYYKWYFGDGETSEDNGPVHKYKEYRRYNISLVAISETGCVDSVSLSDAFTDTGCYLRFPNAFTPNTGGPTGGYYTQHTDQANMVFHPVCSGVTGFNLKIFSKQGLLVFESDDIYLGWDGYYKGQLCISGVYVWKARGTFRNGETYVMSGDLTLVNY
jgi:PKD repeat protein